MNVELISIGDELLLGQTVNTNAAWLGEELAELGASVQQCVVIRDTEEAITEAIEKAFEKVDLVIVTGGLGPTKDDITKKVLCDYFGTKLVLNQKVLEHVRKIFEKGGRSLLETNVQQAAVPEAAEILFNYVGTAPGMWFEKSINNSNGQGKVLISLPGVPYEMKQMMKEEGFAKIKERFKLESMYFRTIHTQGIGESFLADKIAMIENELRDEGLSLAYLPSPGQVRLRISAGKNKEHIGRIDYYLDKIAGSLPKYVYGFDNTTLAEVVGDLLRKDGLTVGTVESCTGGSIAFEIVKIAGSSNYFQGSLVCYSNELKQSLAEVTPGQLKEFGAVSQQVVEQMAIGGRKRLKVDYCMATSGIAGPDGGTAEKPVGTAWIAVASENQVISKKLSLGNDRLRNIEISVNTTLNLLRRHLLAIND